MLAIWVFFTVIHYSMLSVRNLCVLQYSYTEGQFICQPYTQLGNWDKKLCWSPSRLDHWYDCVWKYIPRGKLYSVSQVFNFKNDLSLQTCMNSVPVYDYFWSLWCCLRRDNGQWGQWTFSAYVIDCPLSSLVMILLRILLSCFQIVPRI